MNPGSSKLRPVIGVFGTGSIGSRHMKLLAEREAQVIVVPQREARRSELSQQGWRTASGLKELKELGASAVVVATETTKHLEHIQQALELGFRVLAEKPLVANFKEAGLLVRDYGSRSSDVRIACCMRFDEGLQRVKSLISEIGRPYLVEIECRSYLPGWRPGRDYRQMYSTQKESGGVLLDLIHEVDYMTWLFGRPMSVSGELINTGRLGIESTELACAHLFLPENCVVSMHLDYLSRQSKRTLKIAAESGDIHYNFLKRRIELFKPGRTNE